MESVRCWHRAKATVLSIWHQTDYFISIHVRNILLQTAGMKSEKDNIWMEMMMMPTLPTEQQISAMNREAEKHISAAIITFQIKADTLP